MEREGFTPEFILGLCGAANFQRGLTYFQAGRVVDIKRTNRGWEIAICGTSFRIQRVTIVLEGGVRASCECPSFSAWKEPCKHIAAALFALHEQQSAAEAAVEEAVEEFSLRDLVMDYLLRRPEPAFAESLPDGGIRLTVTDPSASTTVQIRVSAKEADEFRERLQWGGDAADQPLPTARAA